MDIRVFERESKEAGQFDDPYKYTDGEEAIEIATYFGYKEAEEVTGVFVLVGDGEYDEVWVTQNSKPYGIYAHYIRLEQVIVPDWYHGEIGTNNYVAKCWLYNLPARSGNGNFWTDGIKAYSYKMKIGRTRDGFKQVLLATDFSRVTAGHVRALRSVDNQERAFIELIEPVRMTGRLAPTVVIGRNHKQYKNEWLFFPDAAPQVNAHVENFQPGMRVVTKRATKSYYDVIVPAYSWGTVGIDDPLLYFNGYVLIELDTGESRYIRSYELAIHEPKTSVSKLADRISDEINTRRAWPKDEHPEDMSPFQVIE